MSSTPSKRKFHDGDDAEQLQQQDKKLKSTNDIDSSINNSYNNNNTNNNGTSTSTSTSTSSAPPPKEETAIERKKRELREKILKSKQELNNIINVDQNATTIQPTPTAATTTIATTNVAQQQQQQQQQPITIDKKDEVVGETNQENNEMFFDPRIKVSNDKKKKLNSFTFIQPGRYSKKADKLRSQALAEEMKKQVELNSLNSKKNTESMETIISISEVPSIEWWDNDILKDEIQNNLNNTENNNNDIKENQINQLNKIILNCNYLDNNNNSNEELKNQIINSQYWGYIEHPVKIRTKIQSKDTTPPPIRPDFLLLTKEKKRMRKQRRAEELRERQERIMNGMEAPPENKVKLSNLMRVIGTQAVLDPTKALMEVTKKIEERIAAHDKRNQENKLTPEQRKEKKRDKILIDAKQELYCSLYKIVDLSHPLYRSIIGRNSKENLATGCIVFHPSCNLVAFEGGLRVQKKFKKLLLNRIDWDNPPPIKQNDPEQQQQQQPSNNKHQNNSDLYPKPPEGTPNSCHLVWSGPIHEAHFKAFDFEISPLESQARKYLQEHNVPHYWDMVKNFSPDI
ncbi:hypothetical protein ACTFIU_011026 [Dictyostelium citrinum]